MSPDHKNSPTHRIRGGSWIGGSPIRVRAAVLGWDAPMRQVDDIGFRCVLNLRTAL